MGGDDSQKLLPWRGMQSSPGRSRPPAHCKIYTLKQIIRWLLRGRQHGGQAKESPCTQASGNIVVVECVTFPGGIVCR